MDKKTIGNINRVRYTGPTIGMKSEDAVLLDIRNGMTGTVYQRRPDHALVEFDGHKIQLVRIDWDDLLPLVDGPIEGLLAAFQLCAHAHAKQQRQDGTPYIHHPIEVALQAQAASAGNADAIMVALMHDVIEDSDIDLTELPFETRVMDAIDAITRRRGELYFAYIRRCAENPLAAFVKTRDLEHNLAACQRDPRLWGLAERYRRALRIIREDEDAED